MDPLLIDFMGGKSGLLAAMGPTGSGKTHTMFGSPREPGMVPLALRRIFNHAAASANHPISRSYYLSMFEIYSERGKGERIFDLSPDGGDLSFQQSAIKGLQEIRISDATEAESLVVRCLLKRATAATSANNQSSRSQCIINIRCTLENLCDKNDLRAHDTVLTIADLAGAERERKTGNQGARLLESNFINNTSMVFGLCLRSLLEHQKNPRKSFEKHFKNSLLTRYLRDYLEGKKRMTLILTVKPGEDDYLDTSFLLRQASPYMKIKFNNVEDAPNVPRQKRNTTLSFQTEDHKRRKIIDSIEVAGHGKSDGDAPDECQIPEKEVYSEKLQEIEVQHMLNMSSESIRKLHIDEKLKKEFQVELARMKRNDEVMRKFSKALWSVLKQYKNKLEESEDKVRSLKKTLAKEINQVVELKNELKELRSCCSCYKHLYTEANPRAKADSPFTHPVNSLSVSSPDHLDVKNTDTELTDGITPTPICHSPEISTVAANEGEGLGLKGILLDANLSGDSRSAFRSAAERRSSVVERKKISAYDSVYSSFPSGFLERQNDQTNESLPELEHDLEDSEPPSNLSVTDPSDLSIAEMTCENVISSSVLIYTTESDSTLSKESLSKDDKKLEISGIADSSYISEDVNGHRHEIIQDESKSSLVQGHCNKNLVQLGSLRAMEIPSSKSFTGMNFAEETSHSDVVVVPDLAEESTSVLSSTDRSSTLLMEKEEASDTACSLSSAEDTKNLNVGRLHSLSGSIQYQPLYQNGGNLHECKHKPKDVEVIKDAEISHNASLTGMNFVEETSQSDVMVVPDQVEGSTYVLSSSDRCSTLVVEKVEVSDTACSILYVEDINNLNNELLYQKGGNLHECEHKSEDVVVIEDGEKESSHSASLTEETSHSDIVAILDQVKDSTSLLSSSDGCSTLLVKKVEASDTACSMLSVEDTKSLNNESLCQKGENLYEYRHKAEYVEVINNGEKESSQNASLTEAHSHTLYHPSNSHSIEDDEKSIAHKKESLQEIKLPDLEVPLVDVKEKVKEKDGCQVREHLNEKHSSSTKITNAEKPKRRLLPASALLLKEFNGLDLEAENAKEVRNKLSAVGRGRSEGSKSLVRLLTGKQ
ncbi:uncharacterized protein A4U43_C04F21410 [Asparagus officinalis]|uniref:Kinesin motor domain-containing protein n=2 Tax=Asparagus officinalis TaxID=4686 RepID=A0A5P1F7K1_ASPOF|nr:uncharacterized protein A4U43_C04F21410 [Asparagus officinalis]